MSFKSGFESREQVAV